MINTARRRHPPTTLRLWAFVALASANAMAQSTTNLSPAQTTDNTASIAPSSATSNTASTNTPSTPATSSLPALSSSSGNTNSSPMPTLSQTTNNAAIPTYPAPTIPPTNNAPFMHQSTAPDGTVFIAVGAILGFFGVAILTYRAILGWLLHRNVEKAAAAAQSYNDSKHGGRGGSGGGSYGGGVRGGRSGGGSDSRFPAPPAGFYKYSDHDSTTNMLSGSGGGASGGRGVRRTTRGPNVPSATPSQTNLFFSPTAAAAAAATTTGSASNRHSSFLPSGFYAANTNAPSPSGGSGHGTSISMSNLPPRPDSKGYFSSGTYARETPPESPLQRPRYGHTAGNGSLGGGAGGSRPGSARAPSVFLDDLMDGEPSAFPAAGMGRGHGNGGGGGSGSMPPGRFNGEWH